MVTLSQCYANRDAREAFGLSTIKTYNAEISSIYVENGFNIREINQEHVEDIKESIMLEKYIPPIVVDVTEKGLRVVDGHHRYFAYLKAIESGYPVVRVRVEGFQGDDADKVSLMLGSARGLKLTPINIANGFSRYVKLGLTISEIAKRENRSESFVRSHLALVECEPEIIEMVNKQELNYSDAIKIQKEHGLKAADYAKNLLEKAKENGKSKVVSQKFNYKTAYTKLSKEVQSVINDLDNADIENSAEVITKALTDLNNILTAINLSNNIDN